MTDRSFYASTYVVADGVTRTWPFSFSGVNTGQESGVTPYLYPEDVKVQEIYTDTAGNKQTVQRTGVLNAPNQITIDGPAILAGREIRIYRETELRFPLVDYRDLQSVSEHDLDLANRQAVFIAQETRDTASANLVYDKQGHFNAGGRRVVNMAPGIDDKDAVNMSQLTHTVRVPANEYIQELPIASERRGRVLTFDVVTGQPIVQVPTTSSALELEMRLSSENGISLIGGATVNVASLGDLTTVRKDVSQRYDVLGWHAGSTHGGGEFVWLPNVPRANHDGAMFISPTVPRVEEQTGHLSERTNKYLAATGESDRTALGCFARVCTTVSPEDFGAVRGVREVTVSATGNVVTGSLTAADLGRKIQIFAAGTNNASHSSFIETATGTGGTIRKPVGRAVTAVKAYVGHCAYGSFTAMAKYLTKTARGNVVARGIYLLANDEGNMVFGHQVNLGADNTEYDMRGAIIFGMLPLVRLTSAGVVESPRRCRMYGHTTVLLGDRLNALTGNTNWNAVAIAAIDCRVYDFDVYVGPGCRGISVQSSSVQAPIRDVHVYDFTLTAYAGAGPTCDAIDISAGKPDLIDGVYVRDGILHDFGKVIGVTNQALTYLNRNVYIDRITAYGECIKIGNINRTRGFHVRDLVVEKYRDEGLLFNACRLGDITALRSDCVGAAATAITVFDPAPTVSEDVQIRIHGAYLTSSGAKFSRGAIELGTHGVSISDSDMCDGVNGVYDNGYSGSVTNSRFRNNTADVRPVVNSRLMLSQCTTMSGALRPVPSSASGCSVAARVVFNGVVEDGQMCTLLSAFNVVSVKRITAGDYEVTLRYPHREVLAVSGGGRTYGGKSAHVTRPNTPTAGVLVHRITLTVNNALVESDVVSVIFV